MQRAIGRSSLRTGFDVEVVGGGLETRGVLASSVYASDRSFSLSRDRSRSRSWQGKSINMQIIILPLTSVDRVLRKRSILKKGDINRNQVPAKTRTITPISLLNSRVTKEDTLQGLHIEFRRMWTDISNKASTSKYPRFNGKQRFIWKKGCDADYPNSRLRKASG